MTLYVNPESNQPIEMTLIDIINRLDGLVSSETIYLQQPWTPDSLAIVATEPEDGSVPEEAKRADAVYFLEVFLAVEFLSGWPQNAAEKGSAEKPAQALILYACNDA